MSIQLVRRIPIKYQVAELWEFCYFQLEVSGVIQEKTQMIINLKHLDKILIDLSHFLESHAFSTLSSMMEETGKVLGHFFGPYGIKKYSFEMDHVHSGISYSYSPNNTIFVTLTKYLRFKNEFGLGKVTFTFSDFQRLTDRERRQDLWILSEAESPCLALKGKFPGAVSYYFRHFLDQSISFWERTG
ncbi:MAG: hypothetical protein NZ480_03005 [Bdellovibrionaceae bacterium]|nr:hypothetical protein [Pseudobdellovibrionaceae bacterium]MDW8189765.1 hypothetical protein [Pseudobdellovibrionaceae bacterium]